MMFFASAEPALSAGIELIGNAMTTLSTSARPSPDVSRETSSSEELDSLRGEPTWEVAELYPRQGEWTEEEYLALESNRLIEFTDGVLEFLTMPKLFHGKISRFLSDLLRAFVVLHRLGDVFWAPISVKLRQGMLREPDVFFLSNERLLQQNDPPEGADLVMEVVSPDVKDRKRDMKQKRREYAQAGIPEYWIVDPETETITVLTLPAGQTEYAVHGEYKLGQTATSKLLDGFTVDVTACFAAGKGN